MDIFRIAVVAALVAGCGLNDRNSEQRIEALCSVFCGCDQPRLPSRQEACIAECTAQAPPDIGDAISDDCVQCFIDHRDRCSTLANDCEPVCQFDEPQPPPPPVDTFPDAL